ncbi:ABC transporter substrate-binding protein [Kyrpidia sp.]|uniref:ABC transporter substrate-binding protein n=1 Tax=Kyrpidia sp. TaxID=2073077 RepID=UPI00338EEF36
MKVARLALSLFLIMGIATGCGSSGAGGNQFSSGAAGPGGEAKALTPVTQVTNWFAEPELGGQYAAQLKGFYKDAGMDMTIIPGGPQVSSVQIVASGKAQFGVVQADDLLIARQQGIPIVAIAAIFQKNPQGLVYHKGQNIKSPADLNGRKVYTAPGATYWEYLKKAYKLDHVQEMKYTGQLVNFVNDPTAVTQGYVTNEPFTLKQQGIETGILLNADFGYNPYANVLFTTEKLIKDNPGLVKSFVRASLKGWTYYRDHPDEINPYIKEKNPDLPLDVIKYGAEAEKPLIFGGDAQTHGIGYMSKQRWATLIQQLSDIGVLQFKENPEKVFTNEFLPGP